MSLFLCVRAMKTLARLYVCTGSSEPSLLAHAKCTYTNIPCDDSEYIYHVCNSQMHLFTSLTCERLGMDDEYEISEGMLDLLFAGHETLASVTTTAVMLLGQHKEVVEKIREELADNNVSCDSETSNCDLSYQKIVELKYVSHVVKEILRLCPPVGAVFRHVLKDFELGVRNFTPGRRQSKTLFTIDKRGSKIDRNSVFDCHLSPVGRQMTIVNSFSNDFDLRSSIVLAFSIAAYPV